MTVEILSHEVCELGEGATFDVTTQTLFWFDILGKRLYERRLGFGEERVHDLPFMASALASIDGDRQLIVAEDGLYVRERVAGRLMRRQELEAGKPGNRSNDARTHPCGAFWIGTMGKQAEAKAGAIYWYFAGEVKRLFADITIPNGICFSPDGRVAYFADSAANRMMRVACDPKTGLPEGEPAVFIETDRVGGFDGSVCDGDGEIWNARWGAGALDCYGPNGTLVRSVTLPVSQPSCPAFCGIGLGNLAVTTARENMSEELRAAESDAGKTFMVELGLRGRAEPSVTL